MKAVAILALFVNLFTGHAQVPLPEDSSQPYDIHFVFSPSAGADGYWLLTNGVKFVPCIGTNAYVESVASLPFGKTVFTVIATNSLAESEPSNAVTVTNDPPFTNFVVTVSSSFTVTNPGLPTAIFALCYRTNLTNGEWTVVREATNKISVFRF